MGHICLVVGEPDNEGLGTDDNDEDEHYTDGEGDTEQIYRVPVPISDLPETVSLLQKDGCLVYVVGTAHFSKESQDDVSKVVED